MSTLLHGFDPSRLRFPKVGERRFWRRAVYRTADELEISAT